MTGLRVEVGGGALAAQERLAAGIGSAISRSILAGAFALGRRIAENVEAFKETPGTKRLSRSFLVPSPGSEGTYVLGMDSPVYAAIHEYGGTIHARNAPYLVFQTPDGEWHSVKEVHIREKRYARDALDDFEAGNEFSSILTFNIAAEFKA